MATELKREEKPSEVVEPNASANAPVGTDKEEKTEDKKSTDKPPRARYNNEVLQKQGDDAIASAAGSTDPRVAAEVGAVKSAVAALGPGAAAIFKADADADVTRTALVGPLSALQVNLSRVSGVLRSTVRGREYYSSVLTTRMWVTSANVLAGVANVGVEIPPAWLADLESSLAAAQLVIDANAKAIKAKIAARLAFRNARKEVRRAIRALKACLAYLTEASSAGVSPGNPPARIGGAAGSASGGAKAA